MASGPNAHVTHYGMGERRLEAGDFVRLTCRGIFRGYHGIVARSAVVGEASPRQRQLYDDLASIHAELLGRMKPGTAGSDLFHACEQSYAGRGHRLPLPHVGHSVGLSLQERPQFHPFAEDALGEDMICVAITVLDDPTYGKFYLEDIVRVTESGGTCISPTGIPPRLMEIQ